MPSNIYNPIFDYGMGPERPMLVHDAALAPFFPGVTVAMSVTTAGIAGDVLDTAKARIVRLLAVGGTVFVRRGAGLTADSVTTSGAGCGVPMLDGQADYWTVAAGEKIAAKTATGAATLYVSIGD